jgi:type I site-specific restriction-modification system R (restriction) subunit
MRNELPTASYVGFTGTPLVKGDEIARCVIGNYVTRYGFQRAVHDGAKCFALVGCAGRTARYRDRRFARENNAWAHIETSEASSANQSQMLK